MYMHIYRRRARYRECDPMGVVYHTCYLDYFEEARTEALRDLGLAYRALEENGIIMPVVEAHVNYHRPARYDDVLDVETRFAEIPTTRVPIDYRVCRTDEEQTLVTGRVTLCFVDAERRRPIPAPEAVQHAFEQRMSTSHV